MARRTFEVAFIRPGRIMLSANRVVRAMLRVLSCPGQVRRDPLSFIDQPADQAACSRIEAHLEKCPHCTAACESLKRTVSLCRAIPGGEVPASVRAAVRQTLRLLPT